MIRIGGKGTSNIQIKIQFELEGSFILMFGIIKAVEYNAEINQSRLHFECTHIEPTMKNFILSFVYKVLPERQKEILDALTETEKDAEEMGDTPSEDGESINSEENIKADNLIKISEENTSAAKAVTDNEIIDIPEVEELEI